MASYPSSVKTFTTKTGADEIQSAHVNAIQDEVSAVESGLLNGLAHTLKPLTTALYALGSSTLKWTGLWLSGSANVGQAVNADYDTTGTDSNGVRLYRGDGVTARVYAWRLNNAVVSGTRSLMRWLYHNGTTEAVVGSLDSNGMLTAGGLTLSNLETLATLAAGNNNDLAIGAATQYLRLTGDSGGTSAITGIAAPTSGRLLVLCNCATFNITISHNSASSVLANRIYLPGAAAVTLNQFDAITLWYDGTAPGAWRAVSNY